jgi:DNA polymerase elongation subunit (family B)
MENMMFANRNNVKAGTVLVAARNVTTKFHLGFEITVVSLAGYDVHYVDRNGNKDCFYEHFLSDFDIKVPDAQKSLLKLRSEIKSKIAEKKHEVVALEEQSKAIKIVLNLLYGSTVDDQD